MSIFSFLQESPYILHIPNLFNNFAVKQIRQKLFNLKRSIFFPKKHVKAVITAQIHTDRYETEFSKQVYYNIFRHKMVYIAEEKAEIQLRQRVTLTGFNPSAFPDLREHIKYVILV